jgi:hypothetical protein
MYYMKKEKKVGQKGGNYKNDHNTLIPRFSRGLGSKTPALEK